jgi:hypothetical protein
MDRTEAITWILGVCSGFLRLSQGKTLSELVAGALHVGRVRLAEMGRKLIGKTAVKHRIKRVWRFTANQRVEVSDAMRPVVGKLLRRRKKPLLVAFDWTEIRGFCTLMGAWLSDLYGRRMTVEELFRDEKNKRNRFALRNTQITRADRIDRWLLILALAYWLLLGLGLRAKQRYRPGQWCSSNRPDECSVFTIGGIMLERLSIKAESLLAAVWTATLREVPDWG